MTSNIPASYRPILRQGLPILNRAQGGDTKPSNTDSGGVIAFYHGLFLRSTWVGRYGDTVGVEICSQDAAQFSPGGSESDVWRKLSFSGGNTKYDAPRMDRGRPSVRRRDSLVDDWKCQGGVSSHVWVLAGNSVTKKPKRSCCGACPVHAEKYSHSRSLFAFILFYFCRLAVACLFSSVQCKFIGSICLLNYCGGQVENSWMLYN